mgnify:CR=1
MTIDFNAQSWLPLVAAGLSLRCTDDITSQPKGCGYQKYDNNPIWAANSIVIK